MAIFRLPYAPGWLFEFTSGGQKWIIKEDDTYLDFYDQRSTMTEAGDITEVGDKSIDEVILTLEKISGIKKKKWDDFYALHPESPLNLKHIIYPEPPIPHINIRTIPISYKSKNCWFNLPTLHEDIFPSLFREIRAYFLGDRTKEFLGFILLNLSTQTLQKLQASLFAVCSILNLLQYEINHTTHDIQLFFKRMG